MKVKMVQHAVGQGGMFCGELSSGDAPLRWVYDCGSNQADALKREVGVVASGGDIDLLFISHLDSDHVNGIDLLLSQTRVKEVVLPYLDEEALIVTVARDASQGALTGTFVEAVTDLAAWFGSRGVETVTFVDGPDDEGGADPNVPDPPEGGDGEGKIDTKWTGEKVSFSEQASPPRSGEGAARMQHVSPGAAVLAMAPNRQLNWALIPYVHKPSAVLMKAFNDALEAAFGKGTSKKTIAEMAKDPTDRQKLRDCYDALWADHNLVSMTLYCGPIKKQRVDIQLWFSALYRKWRWRHGFHGNEVGGWMLTGDAHLDGVRRRGRFLQFYQRFTGLINMLMLPHHGSIHNHSDAVLAAMPELWVGFAAAGPNSYGHPHKDVRRAVRSRRHAWFHRVDQKQSSQIVMEIDMH